METKPVLLFETGSNALVEAVLHLRLTAEQVIAAEASWKPHRAAIEAGVEHGHWDWARKAPDLERSGARCVGITIGKEVQGLMAVWESSRSAKLHSQYGQPLVYVDYLEAAPWNLRVPGQTPQYTGVGTLLIDTAIRLSIGLSFGGRIGLHALPQSEEFYEQKCGMAAWGQDPGYNGLMYYEFTAESAATRLARE